MSGIGSPRWPTWLDIAILAVEKFRHVDKRTRVVSTRTKINPDTYSKYLVPNPPSEVVDCRRPTLVQNPSLSDKSGGQS